MTLDGPIATHRLWMMSRSDMLGPVAGTDRLMNLATRATGRSPDDRKRTSIVGLPAVGRPWEPAGSAWMGFERYLRHTRGPQDALP